MSTSILENTFAGYSEPRQIKTAKSEYNLGVVLMQSGQFEEAITNFDKVLKIEPNLDEIWLNRGIAAGKLEDYEEAIANFDKALKIKLDFYEAWYNRGVVLLSLKRYEEAIASYDEALKIQPDLYQAWNNRGVALDKLGHYNEAIVSYTKALNYKPDDYDAWNNWGNVLCKLERYEEALTSFDTAIKFKPDFYKAWYNNGIILYNLNRIKEAIDSFDKAIEIKPDFYRAWNTRGISLGRLECFQEAITSFDEAIKIKPDFDEAWKYKAITLRKSDRLEEAVNSYNKALELKFDDYVNWHERGYVLFSLRRLEEAIASFDKALEFKPDYADAFYNKACCYALQGNVDQAIENLQQAINLSSDKYREIAKTNSDFDRLRDDERFQALIAGESDWDETEIDVEKDIIVRMPPLSKQPTQINVKHLDLPGLQQGETQILHNVSWEKFEAILSEMGDNRSCRLAYDQGTLEIRMPSQKHEYYKEIIRDLIKYLAEELDLECEAIGSTTWKRKDLLKGAESDNCFYIQNEPAIRSVKPNIDISKDPPPDLILEIDYKSPSLDKQPIYAALGVPEIWRYDMEVLYIYHLEGGTYKETDTSLALGTFPVKEIPLFIEQNISASPRVFQKYFRGWVRQYIDQKNNNQKLML